MKQRRVTENYLKTIYELSQKGVVRNQHLVYALSVSRATVSVSVKILAEEGFVYLVDGKYIYLTQKGLQIAKEMNERYQVLCKLLISLGVKPEIASRDACELEHCMGAESFSALKTLVQCEI